MGRSTVEVFGAEGRRDELMFEPESLIIATEEDHPLYDERAFFTPEPGFIENIRQNGILQAITVSRNPDTDQVFVVDGRQRVMAAIEANKTTKDKKERVRIPARWIQWDLSGKSLLSTMIMMNSYRKNDPPSIQAKKIARFRKLGASEKEIAEAINVNVQTIGNYLKLLEGTTELREAVDAGEVPKAEAYELATRSVEEQKALVPQIRQVMKENKGKRTGKKKQEIRQILGKGPGMRSKRELLEMQERAKHIDTVAVSQLIIATLDWVMGKKGSVDIAKLVKKAEKNAEGGV